MSHGKIMWFSQVKKPYWPGGKFPVPAAMPSLYQNTHSRTRPSQNAGAETKKIAKPSASRSHMVRCLTADDHPDGIPMASQMIAAPTARVAVTTMRPAISVRTEAWLT